jgi:hypothetical protein
LAVFVLLLFVVHVVQIIIIFFFVVIVVANHYLNARLVNIVVDILVQLVYFDPIGYFLAQIDEQRKLLVGQLANQQFDFPFAFFVLKLVVFECDYNFIGCAT